MSAKEAVLKQVRAAFEHEPRINLHSHPIHLSFDNGVLTLEGEVRDIAAKKLALELAGAAEGARGVVDRLRVTPAEHKGDGTIRDVLCNFLLSEPTLQNCTIRLCLKGRVEVLRDAVAEESGAIEISVADGIVTLDGEVLSLSHKRLAGVLAWWVPGCRDVVNGLEVVPPEQDNDDEVSDALRLVLEKDPLVRSEQIGVSTDNYTVTLAGLVRTEQEKHQAELDAWAVFAVDRVVNRIEVQK